MSDNKTSIFISYKSGEYEFASRLHDDLENNGLDVWLDRLDIKPGEAWENAIQNALVTCQFMIAIMTPESIASHVVKAEWNYFLNKNKVIFPVLLKPCDIPFRMDVIQYIDFTDGYKNAFNLLIDNIIEKRNDLLKETSIIDIPEKNSLDRHIRENIRKFTEKMIGVRYKAKYNPEYYFQREDILNHFSSFLDGDKTIMSLTGKAGTGKSSFICDVATMPPKSSIIWLQDCATLSIEPEKTIIQYILETVGLKSNDDFNDFFSPNNKEDFPYYIFIFDAVNEFHDPKELLQRISDMVISITSPTIKILITCRQPMWDSIKRSLSVPVTREFHPAGENSYVDIDIFTSDIIERVYEKYVEKYNILTPFHKLSSQVKAFIMQPLFLKLTADAYENDHIPETLILEEVFKRYINRCLCGELDIDQACDPYSTEEFQVLQVAIDLMYQNAKRELEIDLLRNDPVVGHHVRIQPDSPSPYTKLVNEGLFSQRINESFTLKIERLFITYERVFEYLLALFKIGEADINLIQEMLELAKNTSFVQLRGAAELALSFSIINGKQDIEAIIDLAKLDQSESRQFLCDVIYTIYSTGYSTGNRSLAEHIIKKLIKSNNSAAHLLAIQASFQLKLDDQLVELALSTNPTINEMASLFLYQRWNTARLDGKLSNGYVILEKIAALVDIKSPRRSINALTALSNLTLNIMAHIIDDKTSLGPLFYIWQSIVKKIPGIEPKPTLSIKDRFAQNIANIIIEIMAQTLRVLLNNGILGNQLILQNFWDKPTNRRAFMDIAILIDQESLIDQEEAVKKLLFWEHPLTPWALLATLINHLYHKPDVHAKILQKIMDESEEYKFRVAFTITHALAYSAVCRLRRGMDIPEGFYDQIEGNFYELWYRSREYDEETNRPYYEDDGYTKEMALDSIIVVLSAIFNIESFYQKQTGKVTGSEFIVKLINQPRLYLSQEEVELILKTLENFAYQGIPDFSVYTILQQDFRDIWMELCPSSGIKCLANIRAFYHEEVDSLLAEDRKNQSKYQEVNDLFSQVRQSGALPNIKDVLFTNANLWIIGATIEGPITKVTGLIMYDLISVSTIHDFIRRVARTLITAVFDYDVVNIAHVQWGTVHNPEWDNFEKWDIPRDIILNRPDINLYWKGLADEFIRQYGKGVLYNEL